ncbi:homeobox protein B-H1 [Drosophila gunungcola]|uniref:Uncharacterized protein n=1 Tax=Drosophila gunungcola TaxID=103775 RepID=A0A9P9YD84_9MUSC|nr:homeobox protein B-H1 [Drosophila gunungcola]KAI8034872.1 hypothetical protein M5D96_012388 [Drosophila gunungcola]
MVWNTLSFWDGQPVTSPVYPQMGDMLNPNTSGYQRTLQPLSQPHHHHGHPHPQPQPQPHPHHHGHPHPQFQSHQNASCYLRMGMDMGMGDFRHMSCPLPNYIPQFREPCLDDGEAFRAYNGMEMDMDQGYGGGARPGTGGASYGASYAAGAKGHFW